MELSLIAITGLLMNHWFCDFILQTRKQAENKSKSNFWLSLHVINYFAGFVILMLIVAVARGDVLVQTRPILIYCIVNALAHWVTDFFTSRWTSYLWREKEIHSFFAVIGFDQLIHTVTLLSTAYLLL